MLPALAAHHRVVVASVSDPALDAVRGARTTTGEVYDAAAAERTLALRRRTAPRWSSSGSTSSTPPPTSCRCASPTTT